MIHEEMKKEKDGKQRGHILTPGGGYSVRERVLTAVRPLKSGGCHDLRLAMAKKGGLSLYYIAG